MCVWQPFVYDAKSFSGDFYYEKKIEQRVCLKFCVSNGITATESLKMLQKCFGESTLSRTQVFEWHKAFSEGREVVENLSHASRPSTSVNDDNMEKVKEIVLENRRVGIREIAEALNISYGSTQHILVNVLGMKRIAFHHDNAPSHSSLIVTKFLAKHEIKVIAQPPYSPDLAPCDFFLFPKLKYPLRGTRHESIEAIKRNSLKELKAIPAEAYKKCMENWINRWHACIGSEGGYFEGDHKDLY